jgi:large conductance mechanosensitive channel
MDGFKKFLMRGNLVELAVAVVIGAAFGALVNSFVKDLITPLIAAIGGKPNFSSLYFTVNGSRFQYGDFINAALSFLIIAAVVYFFIVAPMAKIVARMTREEAASHTDCPECRSEVPIEATRCKFCTTQLTPAA